MISLSSDRIFFALCTTRNAFFQKHAHELRDRRQIDFYPCLGFELTTASHERRAKKHRRLESGITINC